MFDEPSTGRPCTLLRLLVVGPTPAPPIRDKGCVMVPMRPAAAMLGSVYSCRKAFSLLGMILNRPCWYAGSNKTSSTDHMAPPDADAMVGLNTARKVTFLDS